MEFLVVIMCVVFVALFAIKIRKAVRRAFPVQNTSTIGVGGRTHRSNREENEPEREEYFTYENMPGNSCFTEEVAKPKRERQGVSGVQEVDSQMQDVDFDLRQAIIYNTILENKYIEAKF